MKYASRILVCLFGLFAIAVCENEDGSAAFMEAAQNLFENKNVMEGIQGFGQAFMQSDGKQARKINKRKSQGEGLGQILSGIGSLVAAAGGNQGGTGDGGGGIDYASMLGGVLQGLSAGQNDAGTEGPATGFDFENMINMASMFMGQKGNAESVMGFLPMILDTFAGSTSGGASHDHSDHSWYMPPILEHIHLMWDHFRNSELGQTLWKSSGLAKIVGSMTDEYGRLQYEKIIESFENPALRRRWVNSLTSFVAEWLSHVSDPDIQQRYIATAQFLGNSFLKAQGYSKTVMFEPSKPAESLSRLVNALAKRHLKIKLDSYKYIKPGIAYFKELTNLASEKGFIMSKINARELTHKLNDIINNDLINPILKAYRAYKWGVKMPHCAAHILCSINQKTESTQPELWFRAGLTRVASFPAAWGISNLSNANFWSLYGAITETEQCPVKYPVDCSAFHEEEIRVTTTEYAHAEL